MTCQWCGGDTWSWPDDDPLAHRPAMTAFWGQPANRDATGTLTRWKVRKWRSKHNPVTSINVWGVFMPNGTWSGDFEMFAEALSWATDPFERMSYWLENQR